MQWMNNRCTDLKALLFVGGFIILSACPGFVLLMLGQVELVIPLYVLEGGIMAVLFALSGVKGLHVATVAVLGLLALVAAFLWGGWALALCLLATIIIFLSFFGCFLYMIAKCLGNRS